jgi:two-component system, cell cycle sensor histidine kinase and response regulator CckA
MANSINTEARWASRRTQDEQNSPRHPPRSSQAKEADPFSTLRDSWPGQVFPELRQEQAEEERSLMRDLVLQSHAMESIGTLAAGLAHDINSVLTMILLFGASLERRLPSGDPAKQDAADIIAAALHGKDLTRNLLNFSHKKPRHKELLQPSATIAHLAGLLQRMVTKRIAIEWRGDDSVPAIECDSSRFKQMLLNLCLNAVDAIPDQGTITIAASNVPPDDPELCALVGRTAIPYVRIEIADDGVGMDAETRRNAFEPFFTTKETGKGTGLGLFMVIKEIQELHGNITIESEPDQGTHVRILLPALQAQPSRPCSPHASAIPNHRPASP